ncbi:MAG: hypothetical protein ABL925_19150 [Methylococcales bacterium]
MLLSKKVFIKRINPTEIKSIGDLIIEDEIILVLYRWKIVKHTLQQIERIKAYSLTSWGLVDYEQVDIKFIDNYQIKLDGSLTENRNFIESIMEQLSQDSKILNWDFLPQLGDKLGRDTIFEKNNIR